MMMNDSAPFLRLSKMRLTAPLRTLTSPRILPDLQHMVYPVFLVPGTRKKIPIQAMPGQFRYSVDRLESELAPLIQKGLASVILFGVVDDRAKHDDARAARDPKGIVPQAIQILRRAFPQLIVMTDVCICAYTTHGHCGVLNPEGHIQHDATRPILADIALAHAQAGAHVVAPSAMIDGQISAIRDTLEAHGLHETILMAYSTKFASAFYGPFREAAGSAPKVGDRKAYQCDALNVRAALLESALDETEGADILMVKPALAYLDVIAQLRQMTQLPIAAYNVSGEYAMICATAERGWGDRDALALESLTAMHRAGADFIISYWANQIF